MSLPATFIPDDEEDYGLPASFVPDAPSTLAEGAIRPGGRVEPSEAVVEPLRGVPGTSGLRMRPEWTAAAARERRLQDALSKAGLAEVAGAPPPYQPVPEPAPFVQPTPRAMRRPQTVAEARQRLAGAPEAPGAREYFTGALPTEWGGMPFPELPLAVQKEMLTEPPPTSTYEWAVRTAAQHGKREAVEWLVNNPAGAMLQNVEYYNAVRQLGVEHGIEPELMDEMIENVRFGLRVGALETARDLPAGYIKAGARGAGVPDIRKLFTDPEQVVRDIPSNIMAAWQERPLETALWWTLYVGAAMRVPGVVKRYVDPGKVATAAKVAAQKATITAALRRIGPPTRGGGAMPFPGGVGTPARGVPAATAPLHPAGSPTAAAGVLGKVTGALIRHPVAAVRATIPRAAPVAPTPVAPTVAPPALLKVTSVAIARAAPKAVNHNLAVAEIAGFVSSARATPEQRRALLRAVTMPEAAERWPSRGATKKEQIRDAAKYLADQKNLTPDELNVVARKTHGRTFDNLTAKQLRVLGDHIGKADAEKLHTEAGVAPKAEVQPPLVEGERAVPLKEITEPGPVEKVVVEKRVETARREAARAKVREPKLFTTGEGVKGQRAIEDVLAAKEAERVAERPAEAVREREARGIAEAPAAPDLQAVATRVEQAARGKNVAVRVDEDAGQVVVDNAPSQGFSPQEVAPELEWRIALGADRTVGRVKAALVAEAPIETPAAKQRRQVREAKRRIREDEADWQSRVVSHLREHRPVLVDEPEYARWEASPIPGLFTTNRSKAKGKLDDLVTEMVGMFPQLRAEGVDPEASDADEQFMQWLGTTYRPRKKVLERYVEEIRAEETEVEEAVRPAAFAETVKAHLATTTKHEIDMTAPQTASAKEVNALFGLGPKAGGLLYKQESVDIADIDVRKATPKAGLWGRYWGSSRKPHQRALIMQGGHEGIVTDILYWDLRKGVNIQHGFEDEADDWLKRRFQEEGIDRTSKVFLGMSRAFHPETIPAKVARKLLRKEPVHWVRIKLPSGRTIQMTSAERIEFLMHWRAAHNREALLENGFVFPSDETHPYLLDEPDFEAIVESATQMELKVAGLFREYLDTVSDPVFQAAWENVPPHVGEKKIVDDNYWHLRRSTRYVRKAKGVEPGRVDFDRRTLEGLGIFKERQEDAGGPVVIGDAFVEMRKHIRQIGLYVGLARPLHNAKQLLNHPGFVNTVERKHGRTYVQKTRDYLERLESFSRRTDDLERFTWGALRRLCTAILFLKPGLGLKQRVSVLMALDEIEAKYLLPQAAKPTASKETKQKMRKWSPEIRARMEGRIFREAAEVADVGEVRRFFTGKVPMMQKVGGAFLRHFDTDAIGAIWEAVETKYQDQGLKGDELMRKTAEETERIIPLNQPTWHMVDRSDFAASPRAWARMLTLFMSQRNTNVNGVLRAHAKYGYTMGGGGTGKPLPPWGKEGLKAKAKYLKSILLFMVVNAIGMELITQLINRARGRRHRSRFPGPLSALVRLTGTMLSNFYFVGPVFTSLASKIDRGYSGWDVSTPVLDLANDTVRLVADAARAVEEGTTKVKYKSGAHKGEEKWRVTMSRLIRRGIMITGGITGIPVSGPYYLAEGLKKRIAPSRRDLYENRQTLRDQVRRNVKKGNYQKALRLILQACEAIEDGTERETFYDAEIDYYEKQIAQRSAQ